MAKETTSAYLRKITPEDKPELERLIGLTLTIEYHVPAYIDEEIAKMTQAEKDSLYINDGSPYHMNPEYFPKFDESIWADIRQVRGYNINGFDYMLELIVEEDTNVLRTRADGEKGIFMAYFTPRPRGYFRFTLSSKGVLVPDSPLLTGIEYYYGPIDKKIVLAGNDIKGVISR